MRPVDRTGGSAAERFLRRAVAAVFAGALVFGAAACTDNDAGTDGVTGIERDGGAGGGHLNDADIGDDDAEG